MDEPWKWDGFALVAKQTTSASGDKIDTLGFNVFAGGKGGGGFNSTGLNFVTKLGAWHHVIVTGDSAGKWCMWADGVNLGCESSVRLPQSFASTQCHLLMGGGPLSCVAT